MDNPTTTVKIEQKVCEHAPVQATPTQLPTVAQPLQVMLGPPEQTCVAEQLRILGELRKDGLLNESQHQRATEITLEANTQLNALVRSQLQTDKQAN